MFKESQGFAVQPSQFSSDETSSACVSVCVLFAMHALDLEAAMNVLTLPWKMLMRDAAVLHAHWRATFPDRSITFPTVEEIAGLDSELSALFREYFGETESIAGSSLSFSTTFAESNPDGTRLGYSIEEALGKLEVRDALVFVCADNAYCVWRASDRYVLMDSHGRLLPSSGTYVALHVDTDTAAGDLRMIFARTAPEKILWGVGWSGVILRAVKDRKSKRQRTE